MLWTSKSASTRLMPHPPPVRSSVARLFGSTPTKNYLAARNSTLEYNDKGHRQYRGDDTREGAEHCMHQCCCDSWCTSDFLARQVWFVYFFVALRELCLYDLGSSFDEGLQMFRNILTPWLNEHLFFANSWLDSTLTVWFHHSGLFKAIIGQIFTFLVSFAKYASQRKVLLEESTLKWQ